MKNIYIEDNFLSNGKIAEILNYIEQTDPWIVTNDEWSGRFVHLSCITENDTRVFLENVCESVGDIIKKNTGNDVKVQTCQLVKWREGDKLDPPHADCEHLDGSPHPYPDRHYSALIYLNEDYEGGQIFFPNQNLEPEISPGTLVQFEGTKEFLHGVCEVTKGERYTIVMFFTRIDD